MPFSVAGSLATRYESTVDRTVTPMAVTPPPELAVGDYYVILTHFGSIGAGTVWTCNDPGFTRLTDLGANPGRMVAAWGRRITDASVLADVASTGFTSAVATVTRSGSIALALRGLDSSVPFVEDSAWSVFSGASSSLAWPTAPSGDVNLWIAYSTGVTTTAHPVMAGAGGATEIAQVTSFNASPGTYSEETGVASIAQSSTVFGVFQGGTGVTFANSNVTYGVIGIGLDEAAASPGIDMTGLTNTDGEYAYLKALTGGTGSLEDLRALAYLPNEFDFFAAGSGLTPKASFSLNDHRLAYYRAVGGTTTGTLADAIREALS